MKCRPALAGSSLVLYEKMDLSYNIGERVC